MLVFPLKTLRSGKGLGWFLPVGEQQAAGRMDGWPPASFLGTAPLLLLFFWQGNTPCMSDGNWYPGIEVACTRDGGDWYPRMDASGPGIVETGTQERRWLIPWMVISAQGWKWPVLGVLEMGTAQTWLFSAPSPGQRQPRWDSLQADRLQGTGDE